jgi:hypothetical protein
MPNRTSSARPPSASRAPRYAAALNRTSSSSHAAIAAKRGPFSARAAPKKQSGVGDAPKRLVPRSAAADQDCSSASLLAAAYSVRGILRGPVMAPQGAGKPPSRNVSHGAGGASHARPAMNGGGASVTPSCRDAAGTAEATRSFASERQPDNEQGPLAAGSPAPVKTRPSPVAVPVVQSPMAMQTSRRAPSSPGRSAAPHHRSQGMLALSPTRSTLAPGSQAGQLHARDAHGAGTLPPGQVTQASVLSHWLSTCMADSTPGSTHSNDRIHNPVDQQSVGRPASALPEHENAADSAGQWHSMSLRRGAPPSAPSATLADGAARPTTPRDEFNGGMGIAEHNLYWSGAVRWR